MVESSNQAAAVNAVQSETTQDLTQKMQAIASNYAQMRAAQRNDFQCIICLESFDPRTEPSTDQPALTSTDTAESVQLVELVPCRHLMCNDCFFMFPRKLRTDKCPACTQCIVTYDVLTKKPLEAVNE